MKTFGMLSEPEIDYLEMKHRKGQLSKEDASLLFGHCRAQSEYINYLEQAGIKQMEESK